MRQPFLKGQALLVEVLARAPQVESDLPTALFFIADELEDLVEAPRVMRHQRVHAERARVFYLIGNDDSTRGEMALALDKLRERDVKHFVYLYESKAVLEHSIGLSYEAKGDLEAAREAYGRALQEDLSYYPAHVRLGRIALTAGDTATALSELDLAVQLKGDDPWVQAHYGATLAQAGRLGDAVEHLRKAIELEPFYPIPYYLLGRVAEMMGNSAGAVEHYRGFLARASCQRRISC